MEKEKKFEKPELTVVCFEGDLATNDVLNTSGIGDIDYSELE